MSIQRILHRITEELGATRRIAKVTSWGEALATVRAKIDIQIMNRNGYKESSAFKKHLLKKHDVMLKYYERTFSEYLSSYSYNPDISTNKEDISNSIWVCWWQGLDEAPDIVLKCIESIRHNAGTHKVVILTEKNYKDYISMPKWIEEKKSRGIITKTNYSDLLRLSLLARYGGMWLDATFFCTKSLDEYFKYPIWSIKRPDYGHASVASGYFAGYSLACNSDNRWIFAVIRDFFLNYWKNNDTMIDYLMVDYMIVLAQRNNSRIEEAFKTIIPNNPCCDELFKVLGKPYDKELWEELQQNTGLYKLTWKQEFPIEKNGETTFFGKILENKL